LIGGKCSDLRERLSETVRERDLDHCGFGKEQRRLMEHTPWHTPAHAHTTPPEGRYASVCQTVSTKWQLHAIPTIARQQQ
jgi:hypothetical protein